MTNLIRRALIWFAIFSLEAQIKGATDTLCWLQDIHGDVMLINRIEIARSNSRRELARLRGEYNATLPIGQRRTWSLA